MLSSMTKGEIVDEIVIDANMDLQWPHGMSLMPPSPACSALIPYRVGLCLEAPCTQSGFVPVPTRLGFDATTLLKMLKTQLMMLKTLEMVLKPW